MQRPDAYYGVAYAGPEGVQGICPSGWHVPTGGNSSEFKALSDATGTNAAFFYGGNFCSSGTSCLAGDLGGNNGTLGSQGASIRIWSSTPVATNDNLAYNLYAYSSSVRPSGGDYLYYGSSVRCVKNTRQCPSGLTWDATALDCVHTCATGYEWSESARACVATCDANADRIGDVCACRAGYKTQAGLGSYTTPGYTCRAFDTADASNLFGSQTLQTFSAAMCSYLATPTGTGYVTAGALRDERDDTSYVVRKYADGNCWLANNLAYGNVSSGADFKTYSYTNKTASGVLGTGLYGVAASPGEGYEGYLYDWQAAVQDANAYYGNAVALDEPVQGICPAGWHVPTGGSSGEFQALSDATDTNAAFFYGGNFCSSGASCVAGLIRGDGGSLGNQGGNISVWSSTPTSATDAYASYYLYAYSGGVYPSFTNFRYLGFSVRCVRDQHTCDANYKWSNNYNKCIPVCTGGAYYDADEDACVMDCPAGQKWDTSTSGCVAFSTPLDYSAKFAGRTMQNFTSEECNKLPTPAGTNYVQVGSLQDTRNSTSYVVRKYSDGKCWLAENLKFGSNCTATTFSSSDTSSTTGYVGTYSGYAYKGLCRSPGAAYDGYLYNWEAAMNNSTAVYNGTFDNRTNGTTLATHDICPLGWHVPTGGTSGEWQALADAVQGGDVPNAGAGSTYSTAYNFFRTSGKNAWNATTKSMIAGRAHSGSLNGQGTYSYWWSSTVRSTTHAYNLILDASYISPQNGYYKYVGLSVRCVKD